MLREIVEEIERLHRAAATRADAARCIELETALARCLQELRGVVARDARDPACGRPPLRIV